MYSWIKRNRKPVFTLAALALVTTAAATNLKAQMTFPFQGSDTLEDVIRDATGPSGALVNYVGGGSSNAARRMWTNVDNDQGIGPMSRMYREAELTKPNAQGVRGLALPTVKNVLGLDALVIPNRESAGAYCADLTLPIVSDPLGEPGAKKLGPGNILQLAFGGLGGTGTLAACSAPERLAALDELAICLGQDQVDHLYRRDDNSGTTDTALEKFGIQKFCNGAAAGVLGSNTIDPANQNLNNQDKDPIRRPCQVGTAQRRRVACTHRVTGDSCHSATDPLCTQGLVSAVTMGDFVVPCATSATTSIGCRASIFDPNGKTSGFAGLEAAKLLPGQVNAPSVNTNTFEPGVIRNPNQPYPFARRLYFMDRIDPASLITSGGLLTNAPKRTEERKLYDFVTDRVNMDPIMAGRGFIPCTDDFSDPDATNLCGVTPFKVAQPAPSVCVPVNGACTTQACCGVGACTAGACPKQPAGQPCSTGTDCVSGTCNIVGGVGRCT